MLENAEAIAAVAVELDRGSVLDGTAVDMILAVGELREAEAGPPTSGQWTPITTFFASDVEAPARVGESFAWHDPRVRHGAREFLMPADAPPELIKQAIADHRRQAMSPEPIGRRGWSRARACSAAFGPSWLGELATDWPRSTWPEAH